MTDIKNRYDFAFLFDVKDGNPNGDPDAGNLPRIDAETGHGLVTDVCLKRKIRNYCLLTKAGKAGFDIFVKEKAVLNDTIAAAYEALEIDLAAAPKRKEDGAKRKSKGEAQGSEVSEGRKQMCKTFYDVRTFGAVMSTGPNAGQVRGPVQLTFSRSVDPIVSLEHTITRVAVATSEEAEAQGGGNRTMGRKSTVPYGLYLGHGFVSSHLAKQTGFSAEDLDFFWEAFERMFDDDRSAARGLMALRRLFLFRHGSELGNAPAHRLFEAVHVRRKDANRPTREFTDYEVTLDKKQIGAGVEVIERPSV